MRHVLAVVDDVGEAADVSGIAEAVAEVLHADVQEVHLAVGSRTQDAATAALHELERAGTLLGVLAGDAPSWATSWRVVRRSTKPVILLPPSLKMPHKTISRVLLPLDGSPEAAAAVTETAELFTRTGVDLVVLHVFDENTVPRFWDQAAHARQAWEEEFLARHCAHPGVRLELRSGVAGEEVVNAAATEHVDLIALGWSQRVEEGRARTVRRTVAGADVPVMLIPVARCEGPSP
ncbi:universal stress protein [Streptosporangium sp. NPDC000396]|uniref:universal stress protein n=1 Tax=Streptosporangium sp. NPDC000396 TaxID=3366185 RepID=UPI0036C4A1E4